MVLLMGFWRLRVEHVDCELEDDGILNGLKANDVDCEACSIVIGQSVVAQRA